MPETGLTGNPSVLLHSDLISIAGRKRIKIYLVLGMVLKVSLNRGSYGFELYLPPSGREDFSKFSAILY